jgi:hypothetical protein
MKEGLGHPDPKHFEVEIQMLWTSAIQNRILKRKL